MDSKYDKLKISLDGIEKGMRAFLSSSNGRLVIQKRKDNLTQFIVEIPGQEKALLNVYEKATGANIIPNVGKNQALSTKIADLIASSTEKVAPKMRTILSILDTIFEQFSEYLKEEEITNAQQTNDSIKTILKISRGKSELTVTWFKTTHKVVMQGLGTSLWDDVSLWFAGKVKEDPAEIVKIIYDDYEKFAAYRINCSDALLESMLIEKLDGVYSNTKIIKDEDRKWLKTSCLLCEIDIELPEYYPVISSSLKVVEGMLRRVCLSKFGHASFSMTGSFQQFEENPHSREMILKDCYKKVIRDPQGIAYIEELYKYMKTRRNTYQHNPGAGAAIIEQRDKAKELFEETLGIIKKSAGFEKVLF